MPFPDFLNADELLPRVDAYFHYIEGEFHLEENLVKGGKGDNAMQKTWDREPEPPTIAGLAFFLGFNSRQDFDEYIEHGPFAPVLKRARLRIEAIYEKKLHQQSSTGAMFLLKSLGWTEKPGAQSNSTKAVSTLKVEIVETGPAPADNERAVIL